jgi:phenylpropionate dioxygenase-like ring-hydroxylating dioxygenase large terminal subunit
VQGLPYSLYLDPTQAAREAAVIFATSWQFVCHISDLPAPGTVVRFDCSGRSAIVLRTRDGALQAFRNACRHRGARLVEGDAHTGLGFCVDGRLRCPYHGWTYDETGALVATPAGQRFDAEFDPAQHALVPVPVEQWRGLVFVAFEPPGATLAAAFHGAAEDWPDLTPMRRLIEPRGTACAADWKLAVEHLLDTTHADTARAGARWQVFASPEFEPVTESARCARVAPDSDRAGDAWSVRAVRALLQRVSPGPAVADFVFLWPNTLLQSAPDGLAVLQVLPLAAGHSVFRESRFASPDPSREMQLLRYLQRRVRRQALQADARLLARVQQGMANGVPAGPIAASEAGLRWFAARCLECVPGPDKPLRATAVRRRRARGSRGAAVDA